MSDAADGPGSHSPSPTPPGTPPGTPPAIVALVRDTASGLLLGTLQVALAVSLAALVYAGELEALRIHGIALTLLGSLVVGAVIAAFGSLPGAVSSIQEAPAAVLAVVAVAVMAAVPTGADPATRFMTVVGLVALTTLATGAALLVMGLFRFGRLVRYLPHPVVGGFLAGTGWLLLRGAIGVMDGTTPTVASLGDLASGGSLARWLPGIALAVASLLVRRRSRHPLAVPGLALAATVLFYLALVASGGSIAAWRDAGLLLGPFPDVNAFLPLSAAQLALVEWDVVVRHAAGGAMVVMLATLAVLLNATGLELALERKVDLDRELRSAGIGNLAAGALGGMVGYHALGLTLLNRRVGNGTRRAAVIGLLVIAAAAFRGSALLELVPTLLVGALLAYLGLSLLIEWTYDASFRLSRLEYGIVLAILAVIAGAGFIAGFGFALVLAVASFVVSYSRIDAVKHVLSGAELRSRVRWDPDDERRLRELGASVMVVQLQGFLFFGSVAAVVERVERRLTLQPPLAYLLLDLRQVTGADASAVRSLSSLVRSVSWHDCTVLLSSVPPGLPAHFAHTVLYGAEGGPRRCDVKPSLDDALEWIERDLLAQPRDDREGPRRPNDRLAAMTGDALDLERLLVHMERIEIAAGTEVIRQGDESDALYLVASGRMSAWFEPPGGARVRLESMEGGTMIGESGLYTGSARSATVVADAPSVLYRLDRKGLDELASRDPSLAAAFHALVASRLADRAAHLQRVVEALQR